MMKQVLDLRYFLETSPKEEMIEFLRGLRDLNRPSLDGFINALEKTFKEDK